MMIIRAAWTGLIAALFVASVAQAQTNPWFGTWKLRLQSADEKPETLVYSDAGGGAMRMRSVEENSIIVTRFDGQPSIDTGRQSAEEVSLAVKAVSPTSYTWVFAIDGKPLVKGVNTIAADGKTFKEVSHSVADPERTFTLIYERQ